MAAKTNEELIALRNKNVPRGPYNITPVFIKRASGAVVEDIDGKEFIDFAGGIGVENLGHCPPSVVAAIREQAGKCIHSCFHVNMYESYIELAGRLNEVAPGTTEKKSFFVNSGAEAVENAIKIARYATHRPSVIAFQNAFHGRTYMAMTLTSQVRPYKWGFGPFCPEVYRMPFAYCYRCPFDRRYPDCCVVCGDFLEEFFVTNVDAASVAAVIMEPVQGEGGFIVPPPEFPRKIEAICRKHGILMIVDEIQSGMGRTGKFFASEHFGIEPDIILTGKSLAAGLPLAGITGKAHIMDMPHVGGLGGTFSGNPIACKAALAVLDLLDENMLARALKLGKTVRTFFEGLMDRYEIIGDVRGLGPMIGMEMVEDRENKTPAREKTAELVKSCFNKGLIILSCGIHHNVIRTLIPFVITPDQLEKGFHIMEQAFREIS